MNSSRQHAKEKAAQAEITRAAKPARWPTGRRRIAFAISLQVTVSGWRDVASGEIRITDLRIADHDGRVIPKE